MKTLRLAFAVVLFALSVPSAHSAGAPPAVQIPTHQALVNTVAPSQAIPQAAASSAPAPPGTSPLPSLPSLPDFTALEKSADEQSEVRKEIERLRLEQELIQLRRQSAALRTGEQQLPTLVGIVTSRSNLVAEFVDGRGVRAVRVGELVLPGWQLRAIYDNRVELLKTSGKSTRAYILMMGSAAPVVKGRG